ncbi:hypothetical protein A2U01_0099612 [Trifolium medium]|uniref:Uncharacterized protein n=1 Tax=Trifolium medium TaxID=97028 RepID=A0A392UT80_9FABA|nr:hypothetical protein [Trifolium medium]
MRAAQGLIARCAVMLRMVGKAPVICMPRRRGRRVAPVSWMDASGRFRQWRVAQLHLARRAS